VPPDYTLVLRARVVAIERTREEEITPSRATCANWSRYAAVRQVRS
jgi:hypothetical protein